MKVSFLAKRWRYVFVVDVFRRVFRVDIDLGG